MTTVTDESVGALSDACTIEEYPTREAWLAARVTGIGGSDAPVIAGVSRWKSPIALYTDKIGLTAPDDVEKEYLYWGLQLQDDIGARYTEVTGRTLRDLGPYTIVRSKQYPWMIASLDFLEDPDGVVEAKCAASYKEDEWVEEPPLAYQVQWQWQAAVTGRQRGAIAVLIGGNHFGYIDMVRNDRFIDELRTQGEAFWRAVQRQEPPPFDGSASTKALLARLYPHETTGVTVTLDETCEALDASRLSLAEDIKRLQAEKDAVDNRLRAAIGEAEVGILPSGVRYRCKTIERTGYTVKPTSYRELRRMAK